MNLGTGLSFSKGPGSAFYEGLSPGQLYKVCCFSEEMKYFSTSLEILNVLEYHAISGFSFILRNKCDFTLLIFRNSHRRCSMRKGVLENFAKTTGKYLCHKPATLSKKRLWQRYFPMNFAKFSRRPFFRSNWPPPRKNYPPKAQPY